MAEHKALPAPLAAAFADRLTISAAELCKLIPMDEATLRRHVRAGNITFRRIGLGAAAPRRFTLDDVVSFLEDRSDRECQSARPISPRSNTTTSAEGASGIRALQARRNVEKLKQKSGG